MEEDGALPSYQVQAFIEGNRVEFFFRMMSLIYISSLSILLESVAGNLTYVVDRSTLEVSITVHSRFLIDYIKR